MNKFVAIMLSVLLAAGCGGETGPTGPQGPQGDTAPPGPAGTAMVMVTGTLDALTTRRWLPAIWPSSPPTRSGS
jgi:hypothetical protein